MMARNESNRATFERPTERDPYGPATDFGHRAFPLTLAIDPSAAFPSHSLLWLPSPTMSDDFVRLVSQANPAASRQQYPPPPQYDSYSHGGQHASTSQPQPQLDPFFDDDDDIGGVPDSAFGPGMPMAMQSTESGFPLAKGAVAPAGATLNDDAAKAKTWTFDDDEPGPSLPYAGASAFPGAPTPTEGAGGRVKGRKKRWRWPWEKEMELEGERVIALNNAEANAEFVNNYVSTSKYNMASFLPKFLFGAFQGRIIARIVAYRRAEQFSKYANLFFLFTACIQQIPDVSPTNKYTTIAPLAVVLLASAFKEMQEDIVRISTLSCLTSTY